MAAVLRGAPGVLETASLAGPYHVIARAQTPDIDELAKLAPSGSRPSTACGGP